MSNIKVPIAKPIIGEEEIENVVEVPDVWEISPDTRSNHQQAMEMAKVAIKALISITIFFSERDKNSFSKFRLLGIGGEPLPQNIQSVLKEFGMKF